LHVKSSAPFAFSATGWLLKQFHEELLLHRITRNFLRFVELPAVPRIRLKIRLVLVLRLSSHLLGAFLLEGGVGFALRGWQQFVGLRGLRA
jgi:hypothetical protein